MTFTTVDETKTLTGYDVTLDTITMAQGIIESYVGRLEIEVDDGTDQMLLGRATAYQAAYMTNNPSLVFEQMKAQSISQFGQSVSFGPGNQTAPWLSPLAEIACSKLSWLRGRSIKTGRMSQYRHLSPRERWVSE